MNTLSSLGEVRAEPLVQFLDDLRQRLNVGRRLQSAVPSASFCGSISPAPRSSPIFPEAAGLDTRNESMSMFLLDFHRQRLAA